MATRYDDRRIFVSETLDGKNTDLLESRGVKRLTHYATPEFKAPSKKDYLGLQSQAHIWKTGDRFYKLSYKYYGNTKYWWVIAKYNSRPTESHVKLGEKLYIPLPLQDAIDALRY